MLAAITGGDSPIGRALQKVLGLRGVRFRTLAPAEPPSDLAACGEWIVGEENNADKVSALLEGADVLFHIGRATPATGDVSRTELAALAVLLPEALDRGVPMHFLSCSAVFRPADGSPAEPVSEESPLSPASPFGAAKAAWEQTLRLWSEHNGLRYVVYRVPTVVPEFLLYTSVSARYLRAGIQRGEIFPHAYDEGKRWGMSYIHSEDVARVLADAVGRPDLFGQTFHLSADQWISEHELAEISYRVLCDFMIPCKWRPPLPDTPTGLIGDVWLANAKARRILNLDVGNSVPRLIAKLRVWVDDFASTARLRVAK